MDNNDYVEIKDDIDIDAEAEDSFVVCDECTKFVLSQKELRLHKRRYGEVIVCPDCAEETVGTEGNRVHMRKHEAKVQCPGCNKLLLQDELHPAKCSAWQHRGDCVLLSWKQGPCFMFEDIACSGLASLLYRLGPHYLGSLQAPQVTNARE